MPCRECESHSRPGSSHSRLPSCCQHQSCTPHPFLSTCSVCQILSPDHSSTKQSSLFQPSCHLFLRSCHSSHGTHSRQSQVHAHAHPQSQRSHIASTIAHTLSASPPTSASLRNHAIPSNTHKPLVFPTVTANAQPVTNADPPLFPAHPLDYCDSHDCITPIHDKEGNGIDSQSSDDPEDLQSAKHSPVDHWFDPLVENTGQGDQRKVVDLSGHGVTLASSPTVAASPNPNTTAAPTEANTPTAPPPFASDPVHKTASTSFTAGMNIPRCSP